MNPFPQNSSKRAFTLIELLAILALITILAFFILSSIRGSSADLAASAGELAAHIRHTQARALADIEPWQLEFIDSRSYQIRRTDGSPNRIPGSDSQTGFLTGSVTLSSPPAEIRFDQWGRPITPNGSPFNTDIILNLTDGRTSLPIVITAGTGLIR